jgi:monoterpene epsilon-lactone hydrolase
MSWQSGLVNTGLRLVKRHLAKKDFQGAQAFFGRMNKSALNAKIPAGSMQEDACIGGVNCVWVISEAALSSDTVVLYFHGGAFMSGSPRTHLDPARRLSESSGAKVLMVDYTLTPSAVFPSQLNEAVAVYQGLLDEGSTSERIAFAGDSAGGNMTLAVMLLLQRKNMALPAAGLCFSPWADLSHSGNSISGNAKADPMLPLNVLADAAAVYAGDASLEDPLVSPVFADYSGFPPLLVYAGSTEILLDDAVRIKEQAELAGVEVVYQIWHKQPHAFTGIAQFLPEGRQALQQAGAFLKDRLKVSRAN